MSEPFLGQICSFGFQFAPKGWAFCAGQIISIAQNSALFSLLGTTYGGNGVQTFGLPDLRGRVGINQGQGPGLSPYSLGQVAGSENNTLITANLPAHNHLVSCNGTDGNPNAAKSPVNNFPGYNDASPSYATTANGVMNPMMTSLTGSSIPVNNLQPYLCINFCIAMQGIFPSRN